MLVYTLVRGKRPFRAHQIALLKHRINNCNYNSRNIRRLSYELAIKKILSQRYGKETKPIDSSSIFHSAASWPSPPGLIHVFTFQKCCCSHTVITENLCVWASFDHKSCEDVFVRSSLTSVFLRWNKIVRFLSDGMLAKMTTKEGPEASSRLFRDLLFWVVDVFADLFDTIYLHNRVKFHKFNSKHRSVH